MSSTSESRFTLADFQHQLHQIERLGPIGQVLMMPGLRKLVDVLRNVDPPRDMTSIDAIISSMTPWEREHPVQIGPDRQRRIANGSAVAADKVAGFLSDFTAMSQFMVEMGGLEFRKRRRAMKELAVRRHRFGEPSSLN